MSNKKREMNHIHRDPIDSALKSFWLDRAKKAPSKEDIKKHLQEENAFVSGIGDRASDVS
ncbi:MAG: hypothetical protein P8Y80_09120 [Acidobacteriota bacterium]|jgi:hypothetical protein